MGGFPIFGTGRAWSPETFQIYAIRGLVVPEIVMQVLWERLSIADGIQRANTAEL
jgi:hypothetical protein